MRFHRNTPGRTLQFDWGWANYIRWAKEPQNPKKIGFTNHWQIGPLSIQWYWFPRLLKLYRHLKRMDENHQRSQ